MHFVFFCGTKYPEYLFLQLFDLIGDGFTAGAAAAFVGELATATSRGGHLPAKTVLRQRQDY